MRRQSRPQPIRTCAPTSGFGARAVHLIDAENLLGGPNAPEAAIRQLWQTYRYGVPTTGSDHYYWASSGMFARNAVGALPAQGVSILVRNGVDGADDALLEMVDLPHLARRFGRVVIASGDGKFTSLAGAARQQGLHVHLVTGIGSCANRLRNAATTRAQLRLNLVDVQAHRPAVPTDVASAVDDLVLT